ncbi:unnamed protein product [Coregonus sp. 'balchen']|nr:unnamed protein product [Coregonus sp. 'balchen']
MTGLVSCPSGLLVIGLCLALSSVNAQSAIWTNEVWEAGVQRHAGVWSGTGQHRVTSDGHLVLLHADHTAEGNYSCSDDQGFLIQTTRLRLGHPPGLLNVSCRVSNHSLVLCSWVESVKTHLPAQYHASYRGNKSQVRMCVVSSPTQRQCTISDPTMWQQYHDINITETNPLGSHTTILMVKLHELCRSQPHLDTVSLPVCLYLSVFTCLYPSVCTCLFPVCLYLSVFTCLSLPVCTCLSLPVCLYPSVFTCLYPSVFTCLSLPVCLYLSVPVCTRLSVPVCTCLSLPVCLYLSVFTCLSLPVCLYLSVFTRLSLPVCLYLSVFTRLSLPVCLYLSVFTCLSLPVCLYPSVFTCLSLPVCLYLSVCTCLSLPVCTRLSLPVCTRLYPSVCTCLYLSVPVCTCLYPSVPVCLYLSVPACTRLSVPVCTCLSVPVCLYLSVCTCLSLPVLALPVCMYPASWLHDAVPFPLVFQLRYRPVGSSVWSTVESKASPLLITDALAGHAHQLQVALPSLLKKRFLSTTMTQTQTPLQLTPNPEDDGGSLLILLALFTGIILALASSLLVLMWVRQWRRDNVTKQELTSMLCHYAGPVCQRKALLDVIYMCCSFSPLFPSLLSSLLSSLPFSSLLSSPLPSSPLLSSPLLSSPLLSSPLLSSYLTSSPLLSLGWPLLSALIGPLVSTRPHPQQVGAASTKHYPQSTMLPTSHLERLPGLIAARQTDRHVTQDTASQPDSGWREGGREGGREDGTEGGRTGGREDGREGGRGGREDGTGRREGGREVVEEDVITVV